MNNTAPADGLTLDAAREEIARLRRLLKKRDQENRMLSLMSENADKLRLFNENEKKLQALYNQLLLDNCPNMLFLFNTALRLVVCSRSCLPLLSTPAREELINQPFETVFSPGLEAAWVEKLSGQAASVVAVPVMSYTFDDTICFKDGRFLHAQVNVLAIVDETGTCQGCLVNINDTTELVETRDAAQEAARTKSSFLANMSHEIRTPMNAIKGLSELLALTRLDGLQRNYVGNIISSSNSLIGIINDVLDYSKIDAHKVELLESGYRVAELLAEVSNVVSMRGEGKDITLLVEADPHMPCELWGDDVRLKQVMVNILGNAVKYTHRGYARLRLYTEPDGDGVRLWCTVDDSGVGIKPEDLPTLFEAFTRADLAANRSITGTGLGLAIAKQLVLAMGGDITVESTHGEGSTFTFWVPQKVVDPAPLARLENPGEVRVLLLGSPLHTRSTASMLEGLSADFVADSDALHGGEGAQGAFTHCIYDGNVPTSALRRLRARQPGCLFAALRDMQGALDDDDMQATVLFTPLLVTDLARFLSRGPSRPAEPEAAETPGAPADFTVRNTHLLVVDDNEVNLMVASEMLKAFGASVECADGGPKALEMCAETVYDIIFLDHMMPVMDGVQVTTHLRGEPGPNRQTPIIALTANVVNNMQSVYVRHGMDDFIGKPVEFADMARVLMRWLPPDKIDLSPGGRLAPLPEAAPTGAPQFDSAALLAALDDFGMYASAVVRELNGDVDAYFDRLQNGAAPLAELVEQLQAAYRAETWDEFARYCARLSGLLQDLGARDCAGRARQLEQAAREENAGYIHGDFTPLMGNMFMLEKKLRVLAPLLAGKALDTNFDSDAYLQKRLREMGALLAAGDVQGAMILLGDLAGHSLNRELDMALKDLKADLEQANLEAARTHHAAALALLEKPGS